MSLADIEESLAEIENTLIYEADPTWFAPERDNIVQAARKLKEARKRIRDHSCRYCGNAVGFGKHKKLRAA